MFVWWLFKANFPRPAANTVLAADDENLKMTAFRENVVGNIMYMVYHSHTPVFAICYLVLIIDTYYDCELAGPDNLCFRGANPIFGNAPYPAYPEVKPDIPNPSINQNIFFAFWCFGVGWAMWNYLFGSKMHNWFRCYSTFDRATHVLCSYKSKQIVMSNPSAWVRFARGVQRMFTGSEVKEVYFEGSPRVQQERAVRKIEFMCTQFTLSEESNTFERAHFEVETSYTALRALNGLSAKEYSQRLLAVGTNDIPYRINTWIELIAAEISTYLYMYVKHNVA